MTVIVGTAGHIDHGKTSLLRALTGIDADRLPEERRRGMTIDVGYAHLTLPDGEELDFVDVPGHDRLVGNMLVGAGEIDAALLVVAADDGPRAQPLEHLELIDALGIEVAAAAVTKIDLTEPVRVAEVVAQVGKLLGRTRLAGSPVVPVSSVSGAGLDDLRTVLADLRDRVRARSPIQDGHPRIAVDRVFAVRGRGIVVTGSLRGGRIARGQSLALMPGGADVRVREIQVHDTPMDERVGGGRIALNLAGDLEPPPHRGDTLTTDPAVRGAAGLLAVIHAPVVLAAGGPVHRVWPPPAGSAIRLHLGTAAVDGRIRRGRRDTVALPDGRVVVRLRLDRPVAAAAGDAFVLRRPSPAATLAGGTVLDADPPVGVSARRVTPERIVRLVGAGPRDTARAEALLDLHGVLAGYATVTPEGTARTGGHLVAGDVTTALEAAALSAIGAGEHPGASPDRAGNAGASLSSLRPALARTLRRLATVDARLSAVIVDEVIDGLVERGRAGRTGDRLHPPGLETEPHPAPAILEAMDRLERLLSVAAPPDLADAARDAGCPAEAVKRLEVDGRIVRLDRDLAYAATTFAELETTALGLARIEPLTPSTFRDATGTSRRYVMVILAELDRRGVLRRTPAGHVPGPRAPR